MKIIILEDNAGRREAMRQSIADRLHTYDPCLLETPQLMLDYLRAHLSEAICISLDHDMDLIDDGTGKLFDPGTGREVADYLAAQTPQCPVILHTTNTAAAEGMRAVLMDAGWTVHRVTPWGDLEWVRGAWFPMVRRAILDTAARREQSPGGVSKGNVAPSVAQTTPDPHA